MTPPVLSKLSKETKQRYQAVYETYKEHGPTIASLAANKWLQRHMQTQMVALNTKVRSVIRFSSDPSAPEFIKRSDSGEEYVDCMLQDIYGDVDGVRWTPQMLQLLADQINHGPTIVGDLDHEEYDRILSAAMTNEEVERLLLGKKGIAKSVKAIYQDGKLWLRSVIDKRYRKLIEKSKGVSVEAVVTKNEDGVVTDGKILGWTFCMDESPANPRAQVIA